MSASDQEATLPSHGQSQRREVGGALVGKKAKGGGILQHYGLARRSTSLTACFGLFFFFILAGVIALILYLVYRPSSPSITVVGASLYELKVNSSAASATAVSASMQFSLRLRNPNERSAVLYDRLLAYVMYRDQVITQVTPVSPVYQEEDSTVVVSPLVGGGAPVLTSMEVATGLISDQTYGVAWVRLVVTGRVKYKAGAFRSAWYGLYVRCDLLMALKKEKYGEVPLLRTPRCAVDA